MAICSLILLSWSPPTNDGWVGMSGAPRIEGKHPTIRMVEELIHLRVGAETMYADCRFTFKNEGRVCIARIGFPDYDSHGEIVGALSTTFKSFSSFVDGKAVPTRLVRGKLGEAWQVKNVRFESGQKRIIRNVYQIGLGKITLSGSSVLGKEPMTNQTDYILGTGRTWKGTIGKTTVIVDFGSEARINSPIRAVRWPPESQVDSSDFWILNRNTVCWSGPSAPRIVGKRRLIFERKNWEPSETEDDIVIRFGVFPKPW